ncbi:MAG: DUF2332 domain-containing protein [Sphingopyxis sp.]
MSDPFMQNPITQNPMRATGPGAVAGAFADQVAYCVANDAPVTARVVAAIATVVAGGAQTPFLRRIREWPGAPVADALALRAAGGLHALHLSGVAGELAGLYAGAGGGAATASDAASDAALVERVIINHDSALLGWLDGPPQTNEAGRSSNYIAAMLWLVQQGAPATMQCVEIGSSAGINLMINRYHYDLGGVQSGPEDAPMRFSPQWRGGPPPPASAQPLRFAQLRGCDVAPVDLTDPAQALRLRAYIWPEHVVRFARMDAAIALAQQAAPDLVAQNAADFVEAELARPQAAGELRVLMHSIVWQYVPHDQQQRVRAAMDAAAARATPERPLAWIALEANRTVHHHELVVRLWRGQAGDGAPRQLATAHAHGAWINWTG